MPTSHGRVSVPLAACLLATAPLWMTGCGSKPVGATSEAPSYGTKSSAVNDASDEKPVQRPKLLPGAKTIAQERAGDRAYDKTFDDIRFEIKPGDPFRREMLPETIEAMAGQRIRIRGFILPTPQKRGIKQFVLVRDNQECCFGPGAALYDCILVEMKPDKTTEYSIRPVAVDGTFDIREFKGPDGKHLAIYHIEGESVK